MERKLSLSKLMKKSSNKNLEIWPKVVFLSQKKQSKYKDKNLKKDIFKAAFKKRCKLYITESKIDDVVTSIKSASSLGNLAYIGLCYKDEFQTFYLQVVAGLKLLYEPKKTPSSVSNVSSQSNSHSSTHDSMVRQDSSEEDIKDKILSLEKLDEFSSNKSSDEF